MRRLQCKHLPDEWMLSLIAYYQAETLNRWRTGGDGFMTPRPAHPGPGWCFIWQLRDGTGLPENLLLAKCQKLINKGLITGCACGCRGDFEVVQPGE